MPKKQPATEKEKTIVGAVILAVFSVFALTACTGGSDDSDTNDTTNNQANESVKETPKNEESLVDKVEVALDKLGEGYKSELASTNGGYRGDIISVEPAVGDDTVKVNVSTRFKDSGDEPDGGRNIARRIFGSICLDVPELESLYVVSSSGLESKSVYRSQIPGCKQ
ncbi:MAG: hypothetical protein Q8Q11_00775 [bacterium]|nr:hypothetical protein [bacterium]